MRLIGEMYRPAIAFLPIGDLYTMGPEQAAQGVRAARRPTGRADALRHVPGLTGTPAQLRELVEPTGVQVLELKPGETAS